MPKNPNDNHPTPPAFQVPLDAEQLAALGLFHAVWSQIDHFILDMISVVLQAPYGSALFLLESVTTGPRINYLRRLLPRIENEEVRKLTKKFLDKMGPL